MLQAPCADLGFVSLLQSVLLQNKLDVVCEAAPIRERQILQPLFQIGIEPKREWCRLTHGR